MVFKRWFKGDVDVIGLNGILRNGGLGDIGDFLSLKT